MLLELRHAFAHQRVAETQWREAAKGATAAAEVRRMVEAARAR